MVKPGEGEELKKLAMQLGQKYVKPRHEKHLKCLQVRLRLWVADEALRVEVWG